MGATPVCESSSVATMWVSGVMCWTFVAPTVARYALSAVNETGIDNPVASSSSVVALPLAAISSTGELHVVVEVML